MNQDDFTKRVTSKLDGLAHRHQHKTQVMAHVIERIHEKPRSHHLTWKMSGFALAAAITGLAILPANIDLLAQPEKQTLTQVKLSPQMLEDLEMLSVLGEDKSFHGS